MKKLLFIFIATIPSLALSMEYHFGGCGRQLKIYELHTLQQRYAELLPWSDGQLHKGWGQEQPGRGFIYGSGLAGQFDSSCYQPSITDIAAANLLHYYQLHDNRINQLSIDIAPLNDAIERQNESLKNKMDALRKEYDETTARHESRCTDYHDMILRHDGSHTGSITLLQENSGRHHGTLELHEGKINTLQRNMEEYNKATGHIAHLETHTATIADQKEQINTLRGELNRQIKASDQRKDEINQFIGTMIKKHNEFKNKQIDQALEDVELLKIALDTMSAMSYGKNNNLFTEKELLNTYNMAYVLLNSNFNPKAIVSLNRLFTLIERIRPGHQACDPIEQNPAYFAYAQPDEEEASNDMCSKLRIVVLFNQLNRYLQENNHHHPKKDDYYHYLNSQDASLASFFNNGSENKGVNNFKLLTYSVNKTCLRRGNHLRSLADEVIKSIESDKK